MEAALARRITCGDEAAEALWCARVFPRLLVWCRCRTRDATQGADLAHEVMLIVLEKLRANAIDDLDRLNGYIAGVCRQTHLAWRRGERRRSLLLARNEASFESVSVAQEPSVSRARLIRCFDKLSHRARAILALCFVGEHTSEEIAAQVDSTASAVRVMRHRALADLHRCLEGQP